MSTSIPTNFNINSTQKTDWISIIIIVCLVALVWYIFSCKTENFDSKNMQIQPEMESRKRTMQERLQKQEFEEKQQMRLMNKMMESQAASKPSNRPDISARESELLSNSQMLT
jgi:predicted Holliday junction resolvase-like endonuclease